MVELLFTRRRHITSFLIRLWTRSTWSHVELIDPEDPERVIGTGSKGVASRKLASRVSASSKAERVIVKDVDAKAVRDFVVDQIGAKYDWPGVMWFVMPWHRQDPDKLFCSELSALAFERAGSPLVDNPHRASPGKLRDRLKNAPCRYLK